MDTQKYHLHDIVKKYPPWQAVIIVFLMLLLHSTLNWLIFKCSLVWCSLTLNLSRGMWAYCTVFLKDCKRMWHSRCIGILPSADLRSPDICTLCCYWSASANTESADVSSGGRSRWAEVSVGHVGSPPGAHWSSSSVCSDSGGGVQEDDPGGGEDGGGSASGSDTLLYDVASTNSAPPPDDPDSSITVHCSDWQLSRQERPTLKSTQC